MTAWISGDTFRRALTSPLVNIREERAQIGVKTIPVFQLWQVPATVVEFLTRDLRALFDKAQVMGWSQLVLFAPDHHQRQVDFAQPAMQIAYQVTAKPAKRCQLT